MNTQKEQHSAIKIDNDAYVFGHSEETETETRFTARQYKEYLSKTLHIMFFAVPTIHAELPVNGKPDETNKPKDFFW